MKKIRTTTVATKYAKTINIELPKLCLARPCLVKLTETMDIFPTGNFNGVKTDKVSFTELHISLIPDDNYASYIETHTVYRACY